MKGEVMKRGFTLIELIVVVIVIGILATLAVPQYLSAVERAKGGKGRNALALVSRAEKMYRADHDTYVAVADGAFNAGLGSYVELNELDVDTDWDYTVTIGGGGTTFTETANRKAGPRATQTITLTETGVWGGSFTP
jgi:prepilin-type N-terminal cleavage/methylation domain-containing protein